MFLSGLPRFAKAMGTTAGFALLARASDSLGVGPSNSEAGAS